MKTPFLMVCWLSGRCVGGPLSLSRDRSRAQDHQRGMSEQREGDEAVPGLPGADLVVVQADFPFGLRKALFNRPAPMSDPHQVERRGHLGAAGQIEREVARLVWVAADEEPAPLPRRRGSR